MRAGVSGLIGRFEAGQEPEHSAWCEDRQSSVLQPSLRFNSAGKELPLFFPPNLHSHLLPCPCIHRPIHQPLCSIARPHRSDSTTLSNRPDGLGEIHSNVHIHLNHRNANALLSYFIFKHCFTEMSTCEKSRARLV